MPEPGRVPESEGQPAWLWMLVALACFGMVMFLMCQPAKCAEPTPAAAEYPLGTVLFSRNADERLNSTPGYWNHTAIYVGGGWVVESQDGPGVILTPLAEYEARPYQRFQPGQNHVAAFPRNTVVGMRAAATARCYVGTPYLRGSSLPLVPRAVPWALGRPWYGMNCITVVSASYSSAGWPWPGRTPDDLYFGIWR